MGYGIGGVICWMTGNHKWTSISKKERVSMIDKAIALETHYGQLFSASDIPGKRCTRCGLTKPIKTRRQKRDDTTKELTAKAVMREPVKE